MIKALTDFYNALVETLLLWIQDILEFLYDMVLVALDLFLSGLLAVLALLPTPDFITNGLNALGAVPFVRRVHCPNLFACKKS